MAPDNGVRFQSTRRRIPLKLTLLTSMYICQTIPVGFIITCLPVILRHQGTSLRTIGFLFLLQAPWALKFLYASWIDRFYIKKLGRRKSWIFPLQWVGAGLFCALSWVPPDRSFGLMFLILFCFNTVMATNDIAVDGYATDILSPEERPWGNTIQSGARPVGMLLGGGLTLVLLNSLGWETVCILLAVTILVLSLPVVLHREIPSLYSREAPGPEVREVEVRLDRFSEKTPNRLADPFSVVADPFLLQRFSDADAASDGFGDEPRRHRQTAHPGRLSRRIFGDPVLGLVLSSGGPGGFSANLRRTIPALDRVYHPGGMGGNDFAVAGRPDSGRR